MAPKKDKKQAVTMYKQGEPFSSIKPEEIKQEPREGKPFKQIEAPEDFIEISNETEYQELDETHNWPGNEEALLNDFGLDTPAEEVEFTEIDTWRLPKSYSKEKIIFNRRARDVLLSWHNEKLTKLQLEKEFKKKTRDWKKMATMYHRRGTIEFSLEHQPNIKEVAMELTQKVKLEKDIDIEVFKLRQRKETTKERKAREAVPVEKEKKKAGKKGKEEEVQEGPHMIKFVEYSNLDLSQNQLYPYSKWIGSILQTIVDRDILDAYTGEPLWKKIYPQKDGVPVYNPSGRYWVKLYYMGRVVKVEIDDKIPIIENKNIFIESENKNEIWPQLFSKAICKINRQKWENNTEFDFETLVGDGSVMYALTGLIPETMDVRNIESQGWEKIHQLLNDVEYILKSSYIIAYSDVNHEAIPPSNKVETHEEIIMQHVPGSQLPDYTKGKTKHRRKRKIKTTVSLQPIHTHFQRNETTKQNLPNFLQTGYAYSITEGFTNGQFNMVYVTKRSEQEIKLRQSLVINTEKVTKNRFEMDKKQLVECKKLRKVLKQKINVEIRMKHKEMMAAPVQYNLLQVSSQCSVVQRLTVRCKYDNKEIKIAKKCIINQLEKPPGFSCKEIRLDNRSVFSKSKKSSRGGKKDKKEKQEKDGDVDLDFTFEDMVTLVDRKKQEGNVWMQKDDFLSCFHFVQVYHNPKTYKHYKTFDVQQEKEMEYIYNEEKQLIIIDKCEEEIKVEVPEDTEKEKQQEFSLKKMMGKGKKKKKVILEKKENLLKFMFGFNRYVEKTKLEEVPYFILQEFNVNEFKSMRHFKTLNKKLDSELVLIQNQPQIFKIQAVSKIPYRIWLASDCPFKLKSFGEYMVEQKNFSKSSFNIEYANIERDKYKVFAILRFESSETPIEAFAYISAESQKYLLKYLRYKIQKIPKKETPIYNDPTQGLILNEYEKTIPSSSQIHFILESGFEYKLLIEGAPPENIAEGAFKINIYSTKNPNFEQEPEPQEGEEVESTGLKAISLLQQVQPIEYMDIYKPYKYGVIFKERLFVSELIHGVIQFYLFKTSTIPEEEGSDQKGKKVKDEKEMVLEPLDVGRQVQMRIYNGEKLLYHAEGESQALISDIVLALAKGEEKQDYFIECKFDLQEWPQAGTVCPETQGLCWVLDVFSTNNILLVKDERKKELYSKVIGDWEEKQPGRAEKAKKSRQRFLLMKKKRRGEELTEVEKELLKEKRVRKGEEEEVPVKKGKAPPKKNSKKQQEEEVVEKVVKEELLPKSTDHNMVEIQSFLKCLESRDIKRELPLHQGLIKERTKEEKENIIKEYEETLVTAKTYLAENASLREETIKTQKEEADSLQTEFETLRKVYLETLSTQETQREDFRVVYHKRIEIEQKLYELISQEEIQYEDIGAFLKENEGTQIDPTIKSLAIKVKTNLYIKAMVLKITESFETFDAIELKKQFDEINSKKIILPSELIDKVEDMLYDAEGNENYQAEKQAEEKKAGKDKGKKKKK